MIFFSSDPDFKIFYDKFSSNNLKIDLLVTESPKKQGRDQKILPNSAHRYANRMKLKTYFLEESSTEALSCIKAALTDNIGFIFAYGKMVPTEVIDLFEKGILNIHFSLLPELPGASPIQQALLEDRKISGYTVFKITPVLDKGDILTQEKVKILPDDNFDSLRARIIEQACDRLPTVINDYLSGKISVKKMPSGNYPMTHRITKDAGLINDQDNARSAYNKIRAFSRWPKTFLILEQKRVIIHQAKLSQDKLEILELQPEGRKRMNFNQFKNGYRTLLTKMPPFVKIN